MQTQWRIGWPAMGQPVRTGLDYAGVHAWLLASGAPCIPRLFADIQACEAAALAAWNQPRP